MLVYDMCCKGRYQHSGYVHITIFWVETELVTKGFSDLPSHRGQ
jgi:hypothetical protein